MKLICPYCTNVKEWPSDLRAGDSVRCACGNEFMVTESMIYANERNVAQQPHYTKWKIQPVTFIAANNLDFLQGNVIKYVLRY